MSAACISAVNTIIVSYVNVKSKACTYAPKVYNNMMINNPPNSVTLEYITHLCNPTHLYF